MFTPTEEAVLSEILEEGHRALDNYFSLAPHCPLVRDLPVLTKSDEFRLFNIYCAFQTMTMFEKKYSKPLVLPTNLVCGTQIIFNPQKQ